MIVRIHSWIPASRANGPGTRAVVWFQGCSLGCPGCFNPETHDPSLGTEIDTAALAADLLRAMEGRDRTRAKGVSFSGGEPMQQPEALLDLIERLDAEDVGLLLFSGYTLAEIERQPFGPAILARLDVLIAGRYRARRHLGAGLLGSTNQTVHLLSGRHTHAEISAVPPAEIIIGPDGTITVTGISPPSPAGWTGVDRIRRPTGSL